MLSHNNMLAKMAKWDLTLSLPDMEIKCSTSEILRLKGLLDLGRGLLFTEITIHQITITYGIQIFFCYIKIFCKEK